MKEKILIIEDEEEILDNLRILLNAEGFEIFSATDGQQGIALALQHLPDLIVCDIMIPGFDGYEVLRKLKTDDKTNLIPFIFITAKAERSDLRRGMELGADDFISKPFSSEELLSAIKTRLHKHKSLISKLSSEKIDFDQDDDKKLSIDDSIFVSYHNDTIPVKIAKIKYITAQNQYSTIFLEDQRNYIIRKSLSTWEKILPEKIFIRVHRSTIINLEKIYKIGKSGNGSYFVSFQNSPEKFPVSRRLLKKIKNK